MTYEEALEKWARKRFAGIPDDITDIHLWAFLEPVEVQWTLADGSGGHSGDINGFDGLNDVIREIVNTALGVIE